MGGGRRTVAAQASRTSSERDAVALLVGRRGTCRTSFNRAIASVFDEMTERKEEGKDGW
jgi:hypothetical protein